MPVRSLLGKRNRERQKSIESAPLGLGLEDIVSNHPEPALLVDNAANVVIANQLGSALADAITQHSLPGITKRIADVVTTGRRSIGTPFGRGRPDPRCHFRSRWQGTGGKGCSPHTRCYQRSQPNQRPGRIASAVQGSGRLFIGFCMGDQGGRHVRLCLTERCARLYRTGTRGPSGARLARCRLRAANPVTL